MVSTIKKLIKIVAEKLGYRISRINEEEHENPIREIQHLYQKFVFKGLPEGDDVRTSLMTKLLGTCAGEAMYIIDGLHKTMELDGDICEFGVAQGATSALMAHEIEKTNKKIWLFDSFRGLPKPSEKDTLKNDIFGLGSIEAYEGTMSYGLNMVKKKLQDIDFSMDRAMIVPGFIEETIKCDKLPDKVSFAYVDFDVYEPIAIALNFLDEVLQKHGIIVVDDYDFFSTGVKVAVEEFMATHGEKYTFSLPVSSISHFCIIEKMS